MPIGIDEDQAQAKSRIIGIRLTSLTLRLMENWQRRVRDYDSAMILLAVAAISAEKLTRTQLESELENLECPMPADRLTTCNTSSVAAATGLNRETARRKINGLIKSGWLVRSPDGSIAYNDGFSQDPRTLHLVQTQLETFRRTANELVRDGAFVVEGGGSG